MKERKMTMPAPLQAGDKIAIVSPASHILPQYVEGACKVIRQMGFEPVEGANCRNDAGGYAGTVEQRLHDLQAALRDDSVKAILCSRGGYGTVHLLEYLDGDELARCAKWLIGFSDISALHSAMVNSGVVSLHASMAKHLALHGADDPATCQLAAVLRGELPEYVVPAHSLNIQGEAEGVLVGGNMAVLCGLIDTDFDIFTCGNILFIEDVGEEIYKIERMLYNLQLSGVLGMLRGLVVGRFTEYRTPGPGGENMEEMIRRMVERYDIPVAFDFPVGHVDENVPMLEGARVRLKVDADATTLTFL